MPLQSLTLIKRVFNTPPRELNNYAQICEYLFFRVLSVGTILIQKITKDRNEPVVFTHLMAPSRLAQQPYARRIDGSSLQGNSASFLPIRNPQTLRSRQHR